MPNPFLSLWQRIRSPHTTANAPEAACSPEPTLEQRPFQMHPSLLQTVMTKQAGTLTQAILEGIMNSLDAGAHTIRIAIEPERFAIADDGVGFPTRDTITSCFELFGLPHMEGDARFGRFRSGRGQLFRWGRNLWSSHSFQMEIDFQRFLGYTLTETAEHHAGCSVQVQLYERLAPSELDKTAYQLRGAVRWVTTPIYLNGERISQDPQEAAWSEVTDEAYLLRQERASLTVYNEGVLVTSLPSDRFGTGGLVVTRQQLSLNWARNEIMSDCPVWRRITPHLSAVARTVILQKARPTEGELQFLIDQIRENVIAYPDSTTLRVVTDIDGRNASLGTLLAAPGVTVAPRGHAGGHLVHRRRKAFVLAEQTLHRFAVPDVHHLLQWLAEHTVRSLLAPSPKIMRAQQAWLRLPVLALDNLTREIEEGYEEVPHRRLKAWEADALSALQAGNRKFQTLVHLWYGTHHLEFTRRYREKAEQHRAAGDDPEHWNSILETLAQEAAPTHLCPAHLRRQLRIGASPVAAAWTNGLNRIWVERGQLALVRDGHPGMTQLATLLIHEYCHDGPDTATHEHNHDFYEHYHELTIGSSLLGTMAQAMLAQWKRRIVAAGKSIHGPLAQWNDLTDYFDHHSRRKPDPTETASSTSRSGTSNPTARKEVFF